jgi:thiamine biosynthesis lipoprotein
MVKVTQTQISAKRLEAIKEEVEAALIEVNRQMSTYDPNSEISRFNRFDDTTAFRVSAQFVHVLKSALEIYHASNRAFDITVAPLVNLWGFGSNGLISDIPSEVVINNTLKRVGSHNLHILDSIHIKKRISELSLDLSAIAKGYGVDVVADILIAAELRNFMVEIGGEVVARGLNAQNEAWKIGVDRPKHNLLPGQELEAILALRDVAVATSGDYRNYFELNGKQYSHTIDPESGKPVLHNLASTTIITQRCMPADAIATAVMVMGKDKGLEWIESMPHVEALLILRYDTTKFESFQTSGFSKYLVKE